MKCRAFGKPINSYKTIRKKAPALTNYCFCDNQKSWENSEVQYEVDFEDGNPDH